MRLSSALLVSNIRIKNNLGIADMPLFLRHIFCAHGITELLNCCFMLKYPFKKNRRTGTEYNLNGSDFQRVPLFSHKIFKRTGGFFGSGSTRTEQFFLRHCPGRRGDDFR